ncbi:MAG: SIR2 family protein [Pirellulaceae bacterium]
MGSFDSNTVFVLGAGFTKAFLPDAPVLVDDFEGERLANQYAAFTYESAILQEELRSHDHQPGQLNLERLMTRLAGGMPYDYAAGSAPVFAAMLADLKLVFLRRLAKAKSGSPRDSGALRLFAEHVVAKKCTCITFNYDDLLDEALWRSSPTLDPRVSWSPDWGYGFPCRMSEACVRQLSIRPAHRDSLLLLKMHGSVNWRIPIGTARPYGIESIRHHESWYWQGHEHDKVSLESLDPFFVQEPMIVPPVLSKVELNEQPVLQLTWRHAIDSLENASRVIFIGYSLPRTDIAAETLFREGVLGDCRDRITIVDYAINDSVRDEKRNIIESSYGRIFRMSELRDIHLDGAAHWITNALTTWYFDSNGAPVAYEGNGLLWTRHGSFLGHRWKDEVWGHEFVGRIVDNRLLRPADRPNDRPVKYSEPDFNISPDDPANSTPICLPTGWSDLVANA